jgi:hypothetical protein
MIAIDNKYEIGSIVYLKTDGDQCARMITEIIVKPNDFIVYGCSMCTNDTHHYECELSSERNEEVMMESGAK